ncbi:ABC transporter permease [Streptomyces sp. NBC_00569]|uniref:ABC transporter permease n=1 Tax=unclassified Streptomyces TaxID=2593676 RepID=UPI002256CCF3|nr:MULTISPECIES: ABC transporter permease [unclassified Streptomyces]MCX5438755.1 ABC transporter permease [Streptomyces sp. NBC_00063]WUB94734.1 ABC transporter permease [Streptomyces sp. NBC_00569]
MLTTLTTVWANLRTRRHLFAGAFVAVALGVALVASMGLGLAAAADPPAGEPQRFAAQPVVVMPHDTLTVEVDRGPHRAHASKKIPYPQPVDKELLRELAALGTVHRDHLAPDAVGVDASAAAVREVVGDRAQVLTGAARRLADPGAERDAQAVVAVRAMLGTAGGVSAFVAVFVTASTFAFVVALRRREFGLLRLAGATPGRVRRQLVTEALAVGVAASATGCALGSWGAPLLARALIDNGIAPSWFTVSGAHTPQSTSWNSWTYWTYWPFQLAFWTGLFVAVAGAWAASRRAGRIRPVEALRDADVDTDVMPWSRRIAGAALLALGLGLTVHTLWTDPSALLKRKTYTTQPMILITAAAALAPLLVRPVLRLIRLPGAVGLLVRENAATSVRRTAAVAAPVLVTVALAGSLMGSAESVSAAKAQEANEQMNSQLITTGDALALTRRPVPGVAAVSPSASTAVFVREEGTALLRSEARAVTDPAALAATSRLPVVSGDIRHLDDRSIVVNEEWEHHRVGDRLSVWLGDGRRTTLRVAAVLARGTGDNGAYVTMANAGAAPVDRIDVRLTPGASPAAVTDALRAATSGHDVRVRTAAAWLDATHPRVKPQTRHGMLLLLGIALTYTAISLAGTQLMSASVRDGELRALRRAGAIRAQVRLMLAGEALVAVAAGTALGLAVTALNLGGLAAALGLLTPESGAGAGAGAGLQAGVVVPWGVVGSAVGVCAVVAVGAGVLGAGWGRRNGAGG